MILPRLPAGLSRNAWTALIAAVALVVRAPLALQRHEITPGGDSADYAELAHRFWSQGDVGFASAVRPPGYPLYLYLTGALPGRMEDTAAVLQLGLGVVVSAAIVYLGWDVLGRGVAVTAGLLTAATAPLLLIEDHLLADFLLGVLALAGAALLIAACRAEGSRWILLLVATGLVFAAAAYVKPVGQALAVAALPALAFATRSVRRTLTGTAIVAGTVLVATLPWMVRNETRYGEFTMSAQSGLTLVNRVFERTGMAIPADRPRLRGCRAVPAREPGHRLSSGLFEELADAARRRRRPSGSNAISRSRRSGGTRSGLPGASPARCATCTGR